MRVQVVAAGPVVGAEVSLWWVDRDGHPLTRDGRRSRDAELSSENALAKGRTDQQGAVELPLGPAYGLIALEARGGSTHDPWSEPSPEPPAGEPDGNQADGQSEIPLIVPLRSVLIDFVPGPASREVVISPLTTLAWALGAGRVTHPLRAESYYEAMSRAYEMLGEHFGGPGAAAEADPSDASSAAIDITRGPIPTGLDQPLPGLTPAARHVLALQGMASLAHRMAEASSISGCSFHLLHLLAALLDDIGDGSGFVDGMSGDGPVLVDLCPVPDGCTEHDLACRPICWLGANTLRAHLASAVAFDVLPSPLNQTTLTLADVRPFIEHLQNNAEPDLFDGVEPGELDSPAPILEVTSSPVFDERLDVITFDEHAVPVHTAGENALIDLGQAQGCPTVGKHVHRLAAADTNPLRWQVVLRDRTGWPVEEGSPIPLQYRVKRRAPATLPGDAESCSTEPSIDSEQDWLMDDWLPAEPIESAGDGAVVYEVTLLRDRVAALATEPQAELEIVFRGRDALDGEAVACRCWNHVLLPVPLEVSAIAVATGPGSLAARSLHPGNNIAPLLNGVPLEQAPALASFVIRNGTDQPAYVRFSLSQPLVHYTKCWRRSNAELDSIIPDPQCVAKQTCLSQFPPDRQTVVAEDSGILEHLVTGLRVVDVATGSSTAVESCSGCDVLEHTIGPRFQSIEPRTYRIELLISELGALAPSTATEPPSFYVETVLDPPYLTSMTGLIAAGIFQVCTSFLQGICQQGAMFQYYRLLAAAELTMDEPLSVHVTAAPLSRIPQQVTGSISTELESFAWSTHETNLPSPLQPTLTMTPPPCSIADGSVP